MTGKRLTGILMTIALGATSFGGIQIPALAEVAYLDNVTADMSNPTFWSDKMKEPDKILADADAIAAINKSILETSATNTNDLAAWTATTFNGVTMAANLKKSAQSDANYLYSVGSTYDQNGKKCSTIAEVYGDMIDNCVDESATESMPVQYGIITTRTVIRNFPSFGTLYDDPSDPDFDNMFQTSLNVNEPVIIRARSNDKKFFHVVAECSQGWVAAEDLAICKDRDEWLDAWQFDADQTLVVYDDKIMTETSYYAPEVSKRELSMGTTLKLADKSEWTARIINRAPYNNHVVWMPVRNDDGSFKKELALISENRRVSEGFLPLTSANISMVALNFLGDCYGWGGMLDSEDCSGYVRDVYKCFGFKLARNTNWQAAQPVKKYTFSAISASTDAETKAAKRKEKIDIIKKMPVGSVLIFSGHEMIYLGCDNDKLYVISSVSNMRPESAAKATRIRDVAINTLDVLRSNGQTWLDALINVQVPYLTADAGNEFGVKTGDEPVVDELAETKQKLAETEQKLSDTEAAKATAEEQKAAAEAAKAETEQALSDSQARVEELEKQLAESEANLKAAQAEKADSSELKEIKETVTDNNKKLTEAKTESANLKTQLNQIEKQITTLNTKIQKQKLPAKGVIKSVKAKKKALKITWKKQKGISGYKIEIATNKQFTKNKKVITVKKASVTSKTIKKLKAKKKYYIRVRAYKKVPDGRLFGNWSKVKTKKTR